MMLSASLQAVERFLQQYGHDTIWCRCNPSRDEVDGKVVVGGRRMKRTMNFWKDRRETMKKQVQPSPQATWALCTFRTFGTPSDYS